MNSDSNSSSERCSCDETDIVQESNINSTHSPQTKEKKTKLSLSSLGLNFRRGRSLHFNNKRTKKTTDTNKTLDTSSSSSDSSSVAVLNSAIKKLPKWGLNFSSAKKVSKTFLNAANEHCCKCTCYKKKEEAVGGAGSSGGALPTASEVAASSKEEVVETVEATTVAAVENQDVEVEETFAVVGDVEKIEEEAAAAAAAQPVNTSDGEEQEEGNAGIYGTNFLSFPPAIFNGQFLDVHWIRSIHEDCDEQARLQRAREIEQGVEPPANFHSMRRVQLLCSDMDPSDSNNGQGPRRLQLVCPPDLTVDSLRALFQTHVTVRSCPLDSYTGCHTQVDFVHCLVPDLLEITNCSFYWGKMDRYEAERLLDGKPEGTFLLRDSAQEEFLFSVSFRKYNRSLHARIEQWNHKFSFDSHDPNVYTSDTVCGLIEHYKDPSSCMFFEPMLTRPLHRNFTFSLQHLCRASIVTRLTYDNVNQLQLPKSLKSYLKEYHYRQKVRVESFDDDVQWLDLRNTTP